MLLLCSTDEGSKCLWKRLKSTGKVNYNYLKRCELLDMSGISYSSISVEMSWVRYHRYRNTSLIWYCFDVCRNVRDSDWDRIRLNPLIWIFDEFKVSPSNLHVLIIFIYTNTSPIDRYSHVDKLKQKLN